MRGRLCAVARGGALVLAGMDTYRLDEAEQPVELLGEDPGRRIEEQTFVSAVLGCLGAHSPASGWWCRPSGCCRGASFRSTSTARTAT